MLLGFVVLLGCQLAGSLIARVTGWPIPGPVLGMALLATVLAFANPVPDGLKKASHGLLAHMPLFFVPAGVGILALQDQLRAAWLPLVAVLVGSTLLALAATALAMKGIACVLGARK